MTTTTTKAQNELIAGLKAGRRVSAPIFAVTTPDQGAAQRLICEALNNDTVGKIAWDLLRGLTARNSRGAEILTTLGEDVVARTVGDPAGCLNLVRQSLPEETILFFHNAHRFMEDAAVCQGILNLRDEFKTDRRTLILLAPSLRLPVELIGSVVELDDPLPDDSRLREIVAAQIADVPPGQLEFEPTDELIDAAAAMLRGSMAFGAEQSAAMSLRKSGLDRDFLSLAAKKMIEQTPGLTFERGGETFDDVGGLGFAKQFGRRLFDGPERPAVVVRVEELEKTMTGSTGGDLSGTSSDALQVLLSEMEDNGWSGILAYGAPGAGKSLYSKTLANSHGAKGLRFDINACKGSLVGQSEQQIRAAMKTLKTIGGTRVFFVASVNRLESLPPELQRRFRCGVWFFDLPDEAERAAIWAINRDRYRIAAEDPTPDEADLTGADIRNICETAYRLGCSLAEALDYVVPLKTQSPDAIRAARGQAHDRFIDASRGGVYQQPDKRERRAKGGGRRTVTLED